IHDLPVHWRAETEEQLAGFAVEYYEGHLPRQLAEFAAELSASELFDTIAVDEAQDFADIWWEGLLPCLGDPGEGVLFVFADER
ncbi:hypothetical protein NPM14_32200, partial [Bacillus cereus]|uniref:hypothetical protein n=1 Tax=Bacillus cereus TaxID=1396 RepID=UPI0021121923|nr:hypothetical protein [Bacillus cereus]